MPRWQLRFRLAGYGMVMVVVVGWKRRAKDARAQMGEV